MVAFPNFPSDNALFYFYENTPKSFTDFDLELVIESPNMGPSNSRFKPSTRKRISGVWKFYDIVKFLNKRTRAVCKLYKKFFFVKLQGGRVTWKDVPTNMPRARKILPKHKLVFQIRVLEFFILTMKMQRKKLWNLLFELNKLSILPKIPPS